jgi:hypothetical protein
MGRRKWYAGVLLTALLVPACRGKGGLVTTAGVVQQGGRPVSGAVIEFHPAAGKGRYARAVSEADGAFRMQTDGADGAAPGTYRVTVTKFGRPSKTDRHLKQSVLPPVYASRQTTPLEVTVPHDGPVRLELTSDAKPRL